MGGEYRSHAVTMGRHAGLGSCLPHRSGLPWVHLRVIRSAVMITLYCCIPPNCRYGISSRLVGVPPRRREIPPRVVSSDRRWDLVPY